MAGVCSEVSCRSRSASELIALSSGTGIGLEPCQALQAAITVKHSATTEIRTLCGRRVERCRLQIRIACLATLSLPARVSGVTELKNGLSWVLRQDSPRAPGLAFLNTRLMARVLFDAAQLGQLGLEPPDLI